MSKIAINGFGRIGRLTAKVILERFPGIEIVAVNDLTSPDNLAYLFKHDTTYGMWESEVTSTENSLTINGKEIKVFSEKDPTNLPWKELGVELVIESTGFFTTTELASKHIQAGSQKVLLSAPGKTEDIPTIVLGVNEYDGKSLIVSNASCTTNCMAPAVAVLDKVFGIIQAFGITAHAYTATQTLQDGPSRKDFRDGRAGAANMIPSTTGAAKAVVRVLPELEGKLSLSSLRVPVITGSMVYMTVELSKQASVEEINKAFLDRSETDLKGILEYSTDDLVSSDIIRNPHSTVFDSKLTEVMGNTAKIVIWYDNEWGYSNRLAEVTKSMLK